jgi:hypothetical protein
MKKHYPDIYKDGKQTLCDRRIRRTTRIAEMAIYVTCPRCLELLFIEALPADSDVVEPIKS